MRPKVAPTWSARPAGAGTATAAARARPAATLENHRGLVDTKDLAEGVGNLAEGETGADRVENDGHEVVPPPRGPLHGSRGRGRRGRIARLPEPAEALGEGPSHRGVAL